MNLQSLILQVALYKKSKNTFLLHCGCDRPLGERNPCLRGSTMDLAASTMIKLPFRHDIGHLETMTDLSVSFSRLCHHNIRLIDFMVRTVAWNRIRSNLHRVKPINLRGRGPWYKPTKLHLRANALMMICDQNPVFGKSQKKSSFHKNLVFIKI